MITTKQIQEALNRAGFECEIDGIPGPETNGMILAFNVAHNLPANTKLSAAAMVLLGFTYPPEFPWMNEVAKYMGLDELRDKKKLWAWLRSDGGSVGDPAQLPWCADLVETAIKLSLPNEPFPGKVGINPYYSLNWLSFGHAIAPCYGAIAIFVRPGGGHIGFLVGHDPKLDRYRVRGGNQSNKVCDMWLAKDRCKGIRWPSTYRGLDNPLPVMNSAGAVISKNEA